MDARTTTPRALPGGHDVERPGDGLGATLVTTGMAWLVVYLLLLTVFSIFEDQLAALTLPVRLLVVSDVLPDAGRCQRRPPPGAVMGWMGGIHVRERCSREAIRTGTDAEAALWSLLDGRSLIDDAPRSWIGGHHD
jgi:hypothetical protein